jgi:mono/diheme cytochrome c family protein
MDPARRPRQLIMKGLFLFAAAGATLLLPISCYYDRFEALHPLAGYVNACDPALDSTYTSTIRYIMANGCTSCHNSQSPQGNINLDNYESVKGFAESGRLLGAIEHQTGFKAMPPAAKMKDCEIEKIHSWIENGLKE